MLRLKQIKATCKMRHSQIDEVIKNNTDDLKLIKENHIAHIENDISQIKQDMVRVLTILEEREK